MVQLRGELAVLEDQLLLLLLLAHPLAQVLEDGEGGEVEDLRLVLGGEAAVLDVGQRLAELEVLLLLGARLRRPLETWRDGGETWRDVARCGEMWMWRDVGSCPFPVRACGSSAVTLRSTSLKAACGTELTSPYRLRAACSHVSIV